jgi:predicted nucleic acid-binding protein
MPALEKNIVDTGPIVALLVAGDAHHAWAQRVWGELEPPLLTCEAVLSEAQFLVARFGGNPRSVLEFVRRGALRVAFEVENEVQRLLELEGSYRTLPMSLADACLVCMTEKLLHCRVITTDSHFRVYRRHGRRLIPVLMPETIQGGRETRVG